MRCLVSSRDFPVVLRCAYSDWDLDLDLDLDLLTVRRCCGGRVVAHHEYAYAATS